MVTAINDNEEPDMKTNIRYRIRVGKHTFLDNTYVSKLLPPHERAKGRVYEVRALAVNKHPVSWVNPATADKHLRIILDHNPTAEIEAYDAVSGEILETGLTRIGLYNLRLTASQLASVRTYVEGVKHLDHNTNTLVPYWRVNIQRLANETVEVLFYHAGMNNWAYDIVVRFENKAELLEYCKNAVAA